MKSISCLLLLAGLVQAAHEPTTEALRLFERGLRPEQFLATVTAQRERWIENAARRDIPRELVDRLKRVHVGLRLLIVAEDWCPDSVNTVPYIAGLAALANVDVRIVNRRDGESLLEQHRTPDGRAATPTVVFLRDDRDVGAWIERPSVLQQLFLGMGADPRRAEQFAQKQSWYDADGGRTTLREVVSLAEQTSPR